MRLNKQRTAYAVVLGLGLGALAVDRLFLGTGVTNATATAAAAAPLPELSDTGKPAAPASDKESSRDAREGLVQASAIAANRLRDWKGRAGSADALNDAFGMPAEWAAKAAEVDKPAASPEAIQAEARQKFRILGTMGDRARGYFVVLEVAAPSSGKDRNRTVSVGDEWEGAKVLGADTEGATLEYRGVLVRLSMPKPDR